MRIDRIGDDIVHLWTFPLTLDPSMREELSTEECARADRYHFERDRARFIAGRSHLRRILAAYLGQSPRRLGLEPDAAGKPCVPGWLHFNLSHSHDLAVLAVARFEIGIDLEHIRPIDDSIADMFFSPTEVIALRSLPLSDRQIGFFNCWTRKEAFVKALGMGLSYPLERFCVSVDPNAEARVLSVVDDPAARSSWALHHFQPAPHFIGAIAAHRCGWNVVSMPPIGTETAVRQ